ncbi:MAG: thermonuclease family protein [Brevundimonas sp.]|uniref:thermonuclease family protein n=1 Tax=Brevundimonas sp. TaxID=1871086 RepID=UPI002733B4CE|nr:thermonuclease family protein [Brevundimonas sp.]MDP3656131.1 thermonuclease family protein [Brevundimonas sp.]MDZ4114153.1 thermonuclease family protein [Brevundimonas sp.]
MKRRAGSGARRTRVAMLTQALILSLMVLAAILFLRPGADTARAAVEPDSARLEGLGRVIDGDTLDVGSVRVRLHGIDAFERNQMCDRPHGVWACGAAATRSLRDRAEGRRLVCRVLDTDRYGRKVSRCERDGVDVGRALVAEGLALAYRRYSQDYVAEETNARSRGVGAWDGTFDRPEQWRSRGRRPPAS